MLLIRAGIRGNQITQQRVTSGPKYRLRQALGMIVTICIITISLNGGVLAMIRSAGQAWDNPDMSNLIYILIDWIALIAFVFPILIGFLWGTRFVIRFAWDWIDSVDDK